MSVTIIASAGGWRGGEKGELLSEQQLPTGKLSALHQLTSHNNNLYE